MFEYLQHQKIHQHVSAELKEHSEWILQTKISTLTCDPEFIFQPNCKIIDETLNKLPQKTRKIFFLNRIHGYTYKEIAEITNMSQKPSNITSQGAASTSFSLSDFLLFILYLFSNC